MNVNNLLACIEDRAFSGFAPSADYTSKYPTAPAPVTAQRAPTPVARVVAPVAQIKYTASPIAPTRYAIPAGANLLPDYDTSQIFTREQLTEMIESSRAKSQEITERQNSESGDGIEFDLEQQANIENAADKAVSDASGGSGLPIIGAPIGAKKDTEFLPLAVLAAMAYFIL